MIDDTVKRKVVELVTSESYLFDKLVKLYRTEPDLFFDLSLQDSSDNDLHDLTSLGQDLRIAVRLGYRIEAKEHGFTLTLIQSEKSILLDTKYSQRDVEDILRGLSGVQLAKASGADYAGSPMSESEFVYRFGPMQEIPELPGRKAKIRRLTEIKLFKLDPEDRTDISFMPEYVTEELTLCARQVLYKPTAVFKKLRASGRLVLGKAYCGKPVTNSSIDESKFVFAVFVDEEDYVFDWGWLECEPGNPSVPIGSKDRFGPIISGAGPVRLTGISNLSKPHFSPNFAYHSRRGDCMFFYFSDEPGYMERINDDLTIVRRWSDRRIVGFKLKNINAILKSLFWEKPELTGVDIARIQLDDAYNRGYFEILLKAMLLCSMHNTYPVGADTYLALFTTVAPELLMKVMARIKIKNAKELQALLQTC